jgi:hypothetical protein
MTSHRWKAAIVPPAVAKADHPLNTETRSPDYVRMPDDLRYPGTDANGRRQAAFRLSTAWAMSGWPWWLAAALCVVVGLRIIDVMPAIKAVLIAPFGTFFYPLEMEWREGSFWLDALALADKAPIYDHSAFAYVSMAHGPMDSWLKSWIARLFPMLAPWQVTRLFVVLLPVTLVGCSAVMLRGFARFPWVWGTLLGLTFYVAILAANGGIFYLYGRTDDTALVLTFVAFTLLHLAVQSPGAIARNGYCFLAGLLLGASYLTIWRNFPVMGAMVLVAVTAISLQTGRWQAAVTALLFCIAGALTIFLVILFAVMGGSVHLFYEHFYKLFLVSYDDTSARTSGALGISQEVWDDLAAAWDTMVRDRDNLIRRLAIVAVSPILLAVAAWFPMRQGFSYLRSARYFGVLLALYIMTLLTLIVGYLLHWRAGSLAYLAPIYLLSWYMVCLSLIVRPHAGEIFRGGVTAFLTCGLVLMLAIYPLRGTSAGAEGARAIELTDSARAFDFQLAQLKKKYVVVSDAYHFFKRHIDRNDIVDQGDFSWWFARQGHFDKSFSETVNRYMTAMQSNPPDIVIVGLISAPPIRELVKHGYQCIVCGVTFFPYGAEGLSLYAREDLPIEALRAQFSAFQAAPAPTSGK